MQEVSGEVADLHVLSKDEVQESGWQEDTQHAHEW